MNAWAVPCSLCHSRIVIVVFEEREIDVTVAQTVSAAIFGSGFPDRCEAEHVFVEVRSFIQILDFERDMGDTRHRSSSWSEDLERFGWLRLKWLPTRRYEIAVGLSIRFAVHEETADVVESTVDFPPPISRLL